MADRKDRANLIPPRWLHCPRKGQLVIGKFLPFKTPLSSKYEDQIPAECRFDTDMLFMSLKSKKVQMGILIDLTNTSRFYDKADVEKEDCRYLKLQCRGHGETPSEEQVETFLNIAHNYIRTKPLDVIGIHCTHGFNRTGFLIVAYLVEKEDWSVEAAVHAFAQARPPGIYKEDYLQELFQRYGDIEDAPPAPVLPSWCTESDDRDDDGNQIAGGGDVPSRGKKRKREINRKDAKFMDGLVPGVSLVLAQPRLSQIQQKVQQMCGWKKSGFPGAQPVSMDMQNLINLAQKPYKVSWKADGMRYMMLIDGKDQIFMLDRDNCVFEVPGLTFPRRKDLSAHLSQTLLDGEMIIDTVNDKPIPRYLIYDIIKFEGIDVGGTFFDTRSLCINKEIIGPRHNKITAGQLIKEREPFSVRVKPFWDIFQSRALMDGKFSKELSHETDGLIFQPAAEAAGSRHQYLEKYITGRCDTILKWKPPDLNSVDFKIQIVREQALGMLPETKGYLYVGGLDTPFAVIKADKKLRELDGKIIECHWDPEKMTWVFMRQRTDKSFPNSFTTAKGVCESIKNPVTKAILYSFIEKKGLRPQHGSPANGTVSSKRHAAGGSSDQELMPPPLKLART